MTVQTAIVVFVPLAFTVFGWLLFQVWQTKVGYRELGPLIDAANQSYHRFDIAQDDARIAPLVTRLDAVDHRIESLEEQVARLHRENREDLQYIRGKLDQLLRGNEE